MAKSEQVRKRTLDDVHESLFAIAHALESLDDQRACVLHCKQLHRSSFYRQLERDFGMRVFYAVRQIA